MAICTGILIAIIQTYMNRNGSRIAVTTGKRNVIKTNPAPVMIAENICSFPMMINWRRMNAPPKKRNTPVSNKTRRTILDGIKDEVKATRTMLPDVGNPRVPSTIKVPVWSFRSPSGLSSRNLYRRRPITKLTRLRTHTTSKGEKMKST